MRRLPVLGPGAVASAEPEPQRVGDRVLAALERPFLFLERWVEARVPFTLNPLAHMGALANLCFAVACVTGGLLLFFYDASVHRAWDSVTAMERSRFGSGMLRTLHRYSSDACMLLVVLHAARLTAARRIAGARWLAWVTGIVLLGLLWLVGWLGYWLVWDQGGQGVAVGTAKGLDVLPFVSEPMSRSLLTDSTINPLLFFIVFFLHMLLPLGMAVALWLHVTRLSRSKYIPPLAMSVAAVVVMIAVSVAAPAQAGPRASMGLAPDRQPLDAFYLLPLGITDRLSGGLLWGVSLLLGVVLFSIPWVRGRARAAPAIVDLPKCNGCRTCAADCPYEAIEMVPRTDGRSHDVEARVDPTKCVGCGVCAGSCDSAGIGIPGLSAVEVRTRMDRFLDREPRGRRVLFACARSAAAELELDPKTGVAPALPEFRVIPVGCVGWVHALTVERALRHGAEQVVLLGCSDTEPACREGVSHTRARMFEDRRPSLRVPPAEKVRVVTLDRGRLTELAAELGGGATKHERALGRVLALTLVALGLVVAGSRAPYPGAPMASPELVVSFKVPGKASTVCRKVTDAEKAAQPMHMRRDEICERRRSPVHLLVVVDGTVRIDSKYEGGGVRGDGVSVGLERVTLGAGEHVVAISIDDGDPATAVSSTQTVKIGPRERAVVLFERGTGFGWHGGGA